MSVIKNLLPYIVGSMGQNMLNYYPIGEYKNGVHIIEKPCKKCGKIFKTKSGPSGYENCKECNIK